MLLAFFSTIYSFFRFDDASSLLLLATAIAAITVACMQAPPDKTQASPPPPVMDLKAIQAPRLTGMPLRLFAKLTQMPIIGSAILRQIKQDNDFLHVRHFAATLTDLMPLYLPIQTPSAETVQKHTHLAQANLVNTVAAMSIERKEGAFHRWTIKDFTDRYIAGTATPLQVISAVLEAIEASNQRTPPLLAIIKCNKEVILQEAHASTERYARGAPIGVLDGVPIAVKDELDVIGYATSAGTSFFDELNGIATADASPVARLRAEGAIIVGKTNMHEVGLGTFGINTHFGTPRNPY
ncbi:hypothetical protein As57867_012371, partial [Aphanomyces stellatus]